MSPPLLARWYFPNDDPAQKRSLTPSGAGVALASPAASRAAGFSDGDDDPRIGPITRATGLAKEATTAYTKPGCRAPPDH